MSSINTLHSAGKLYLTLHQSMQPQGTMVAEMAQYQPDSEQRKNSLDTAIARIRHGQLRTELQPQGAAATHCAHLMTLFQGTVGSGSRPVDTANTAKQSAQLSATHSRYSPDCRRKRRQLPQRHVVARRI